MRIKAEFIDYEAKRCRQICKFYVIAFLVATFILGIVIWARASDFSQYSNEAIVSAIGKAENSVKYPYGIKSIDTKSNVEYARQICLNSVSNGRKRWIKAGKPTDLIEFISRRYCPINAPDDNGTNKYWSKNVKHFLKKGEK